MLFLDFQFRHRRGIQGTGERVKKPSASTNLTKAMASIHVVTVILTNDIAKGESPQMLFGYWAGSFVRAKVSARLASRSRRLSKLSSNASSSFVITKPRRPAGKVL
jgi:hypothetical protein